MVSLLAIAFGTSRAVPFTASSSFDERFTPLAISRS
jgi:hypothetical protein